MTVKIQHVSEYNAEVRREKSDFGCYYNTFRNTRTGGDRMTGYVASYKNCHYLAKTKRQALKNLMIFHPEAEYSEMSS
jgi:hypothetical protein